MEPVSGLALAAARVTPVTERLTQFLKQHGNPQHTYEFWVFSGASQRKRVSEALSTLGFTAQLHSAYKPLVTRLYEQYGQGAYPGATAVRVMCPTHPAAAPRRFELEAYPLAALVAKWWPGAEFTLQSAPETNALPVYEVVVEFPDDTHTLEIVAPNHSVTTAADRAAFTPTGWYQERNAAGELVSEGQLETDYEQLFQLAMEAVTKQQWSGPGPHFSRLTISVTHDGQELRLPVHHERIDTAEALHEELYFSLLEYFTHTSGLPTGSRELTPGQIVPKILNDPGGNNLLLVTLEQWEQPEVANGTVLTADVLAQLEQGPNPADIVKTVAAFPGEAFQGTSVQGRVVHGKWRAGTKPAVVINGGQHANEHSGIVGALRAMHELTADPAANVGVIALENPDGYALHRELVRVHPEHMHHAARYSALGNDVSFQPEHNAAESAARRAMMAASNAQLLVNLHGYPAHEWTRPLSGYLPHGFEWWAMPQGFILMARYQPGHGELAEQLLRSVAADIQAQLPALVAYNTSMLRTYEAHAGKLLFPLEGAIPLALSEAKSPGPIIELISEYPDETVYGAEFLLAQQTQYLTAVYAAKRWWELYTNA